MDRRPRVYLAARFERKHEMELLAEKYDPWINFTSRWHGLATDNESGHDENFLRECAEADLEDIRNCTHFVLFSEGDGATRGGRHVEFGYAFAKAKMIHIVGSKENIFHNLLGIAFHQSADDCFKLLTEVIG